jgi:uncharacterized membrane protein
METLRAVTLVLGTVSVGLTAGVYFGWAVSIMPGLARVDDRTFVAAFQAMDKAIVRAPFLSVFLGSLVLTALAALLHLGAEHRDGLPWATAAFVLYLLTLITTGRFNIPRNNALQEAGAPDEIDAAAARDRFDEATWVRWHAVRTALCVASFVCMIVASML